jgi:hypothetical protein
MRGLHSIATGQRVIEAVEVIQALRRGDTRRGVPPFLVGLPPSERVQYET